MTGSATSGKLFEPGDLVQLSSTSLGVACYPHMFRLRTYYKDANSVGKNTVYMYLGPEYLEMSELTVNNAKLWHLSTNSVWWIWHESLHEFFLVSPNATERMKR